MTVEVGVILRSAAGATKDRVGDAGPSRCHVTRSFASLRMYERRERLPGLCDGIATVVMPAG